MRENYYALIVCIEKGCSPEHAFELLENGKIRITYEDIKYMRKLKKNMTYKQIGKIYGLSDNSVYRKIKEIGGINYDY